MARTADASGEESKSSRLTFRRTERCDISKDVPFHVIIWPSSPRQQAQKELYAFNLDEATLRSRFIDPYERAQPITWSGRTLDGGDINYLNVTETADAFDEGGVRRNFQEYEAFTSGADVTNDWITRPAGSLRVGVSGPEDASAVSKVTHLCARFDVVARQLQWRHGSRSTLAIEDEYDVQDLMHALLLVEFEDVRAESWNPSYLGGASRVDFLIRDAGIMIEVKMTRDRLTDREIGAQLAEDVTRYSDPAANRGATCLVCFIYDPDRRLSNPRGLERDLTDASNERLRVIGIVR